jgi:hypothetical protein
MNLRRLLFWLLIIATEIASPGQTDFPKLSGPYLGQRPPGTGPEYFGVGVIDNNERIFAIAFSPDGRECFYTNSQKLNTIMMTKERDGVWTKPVVAEFSGKVFEFEPHITPDGKRMIFGSVRPLADPSKPKGLHQWVIEKKEGGWSEPKSLGIPFDNGFCMYVSVARNGNIYYTGEDGIYLAKFSGGAYSTPEKLGQVINRLPHAAHPFIAPDESYLIFDAQPRENDSDLFISFKNGDETWSEPRKFGPEINTNEGELCAFVTRDGKYLFFSRLSEEKGDIFWVDAKIIEKLGGPAGKRSQE